MTKLSVRIGNEAIKVGELIVETDGKGRETSIFTYDSSWLSRKNSFALSPDIPLSNSPYYTNNMSHGSSLPLPIADGSPDSWGKSIIRLEMKGKKATDADYLTKSDDYLRSGALRYFDKDDENGVALAQRRDGVSIPRLYDLDKIILEARSFEMDPSKYREKRANMIGGDILKNAVGSLGGARPKVNAVDGNGILWIAKFAKATDEYSVSKVEVMTLKLAKKVGLNASLAEVLATGNNFPVAIIKRFDRTDDGRRTPYISGQTFMGLHGTDHGNYVDLALKMKNWCKEPTKEIRELFSRIVFNILVQNADDHLRNIGFLYKGNNKWGLAPAFDLNPVPEYGVTLKTAISEIHGNKMDVESIIDAAPFFDVEFDEAATIVGTMAETIRSEWRRIGVSVGMTGSDFSKISDAMENGQIKKAVEMGNTKIVGVSLK